LNFGDLYTNRTEVEYTHFRIINLKNSINVETLLYVLRALFSMKIICPDCKGAAELSDDFSSVKCSKCSIDMTYGEYVKYVAYKDKRYSDILSDYKL
jgi:hypothetical protein